MNYLSDIMFIALGAAVIGWVLMQNPPPPTDNNQGSSINFGG